MLVFDLRLAWHDGEDASDEWQHETGRAFAVLEERGEAALAQSLLRRQSEVVLKERANFVELQSENLFAHSDSAPQMRLRL